MNVRGKDISAFNCNLLSPSAIYSRYQLSFNLEPAAKPEEET
jgi:hypothetical protein